MINGLKWDIQLADREYLIDRYNHEHEEKCTYAFGVTDYVNHIVYINKELSPQQFKKTLLHELTHAYIWSVGMCNYDDFSEENVCDIVSSCLEIIYKIADDFLSKFYEKGVFYE